MIIALFLVGLTLLWLWGVTYLWNRLENSIRFEVALAAAVFRYAEDENISDESLSRIIEEYNSVTPNTILYSIKPIHTFYRGTIADQLGLVDVALATTEAS